MMFGDLSVFAVAVLCLPHYANLGLRCFAGQRHCAAYRRRYSYIYRKTVSEFSLSTAATVVGWDYKLAFVNYLNLFARLGNNAMRFSLAIHSDAVAYVVRVDIRHIVQRVFIDLVSPHSNMCTRTVRGLLPREGPSVT